MDCFQLLINKNRCDAKAGNRRCQMWRGHLEQGFDHAAAWSEPAPPSAHRRGRGESARRWIRWDRAGVVREQEPGSERLPWACMGVA